MSVPNTGSWATAGRATGAGRVPVSLDAPQAERAVNDSVSGSNISTHGSASAASKRSPLYGWPLRSDDASILATPPATTTRPSDVR